MCVVREESSVTLYTYTTYTALRNLLHCLAVPLFVRLPFQESKHDKSTESAMVRKNSSGFCGADSPGAVRIVAGLPGSKFLLAAFTLCCCLVISFVISWWAVVGTPTAAPVRKTNRNTNRTATLSTSNDDVVVVGGSNSSKRLSKASTLRKRVRFTDTRKVHPRVFYLLGGGGGDGDGDGDAEDGSPTNNEQAASRTVESMGNANCCESYEKLHWKKKLLWESDDCKPISDWQTKTFTTCNSIHELPAERFFDQVLGMSYHKIAWLLREEISVGGAGSGNVQNAGTVVTNTVFRTQRYHQMGIFDNLETPVLLEENRLEALATERLTSSPRTIDQYAFCGNSFIGEIGKKNLRDRYVTKNRTLVPDQRRLELGYDVAMMLSDLHSIDYPNDARPTMTHGDFTGNNIMEASDGRLVMIDFSEGLALRYSEKLGNRTCRVSNIEAPNGLSPQAKPPERFDEGGNRAMKNAWIMYDKVDVFSLGVVLAELLMGIENPFYFNLKKHKKHLSKPRVLPTSKAMCESRDVRIMALLYASLACFATDPNQRPTAYRIAQGLKQALDWVRDGKTESTIEEIKSLFSDDGDAFVQMRVLEGGENTHNFENRTKRR